MENILKKEGFNQVCVWPATVVGKEKIEEFQNFIKAELGAEIQYLEEILTAPDIENGRPVEGTGGRNDVFFAVKDDDMTGPFCLERLQYGIRWIEDVLAPTNHGSHLYPERVNAYKTW